MLCFVAQAKKLQLITKVRACACLYVCLYVCVAFLVLLQMGETRGRVWTVEREIRFLLTQPPDDKPGSVVRLLLSSNMMVLHPRLSQYVIEYEIWSLTPARCQRMCMREKACLAQQAVLSAHVAFAPRLRLRQAFSRMLWSQYSKS